MSRVSISGLDKAKVLLALYRGSRAQGVGILTAMVSDAVSLKDAQQLVKKQLSFDYLQGVVLKVNLAEDSFDPWGYDRDNGQGAAQRVIDSLK